MPDAVPARTDADTRKIANAVNRRIGAHPTVSNPLALETTPD
jgi:hypothetical protein